MVYSDFKLADLKRRFQLIFDDEADLFSATPEHSVSAWL
jgi:hypothetical protein